MSGGNTAPTQSYYSEFFFFFNVLDPSWEGITLCPWLSSAGASPWCGLWAWPSIGSDEEGGQRLGTSEPQSPQQHVAAPAPWEYWEALLVGEALVGRLAARGGRADLTRCQGTKVFFFPGSLTSQPSGLPSPWPSFPSCLQAEAPSRQSRIQAHESSREAGAGSAMETNFDPNRKAPTPYLLFKANPFHRANITPLFNPALPSRIPGPTFDPS